MEQLINLMSALSQNKQPQNEPHTNNIPKEVLDQYPYGDFPIRYTKSGQETIRINSQNRFSYNEESTNTTSQQEHNSSMDLSSLLPLIQVLSNKKHSQKDMFQIFSKLLFKDNPELQKLLSLFSNNNDNKDIVSQEINNTTNFPNTNKVCIANLKRVNN